MKLQRPKTTSDLTQDRTEVLASDPKSLCGDGCFPISQGSLGFEKIFFFRSIFSLPNLNICPGAKRVKRKLKKNNARYLPVIPTLTRKSR